MRTTKHYSEYHLIDGKIAEITPQFDYSRYVYGYPLEIARDVRTSLAQLNVEGKPGIY